MATRNRVWKEALGLLYWSMLAACTVGPGTVVTCARAGVEYGLRLIWCLIFASVLAFTLQEGAARLSIISGRSLGQCLRIKYQHGRKIWNAALICWVVSICVFLGNLLYECNNFAGGMSAIYALPGAKNTTSLRVGCCIGYAVVVLVLLYMNKTELLGIGLGLVVISMVILFLIVVCILGTDGIAFAHGLYPNFPHGSSNVVLSLVGTTSIGFNLFLGSSMAEGKKLGSSQRGIAFSTASALLISVLILMVGDGATATKRKFDIPILSDLIEATVGVAGRWIFGFGFIAAALSSMCTVPLGAGLTAQSVFSDTSTTESKPCQEEGTLPPSIETGNSAAPTTAKGIENKISPADKFVPEGDKASFHSASCQAFVQVEDRKSSSQLPAWAYLLIMSSIVIIAAFVISFDPSTVEVIQIAQVFNGCLLPFFSICLLLCINDPQFMRSQPNPVWANIALTLSVMITLFLASNSIIQNVFGTVLKSNSTKLIISGVAAPLLMITLIFTTSLRKQLCSQKIIKNRETYALPTIIASAS